MRLRVVVLISGASLFVSACGSTGGDQDASDLDRTSTATVSATPTPTPSADATAACVAIGSGGDSSILVRVPKALTGIQSNATAAQQQEMLAIHAALVSAAEQAPTELRMHIESLNEPFAEFADIANAGGGSLTMDTSHVMTDVTNVMGSCADLGYRVQQ